MKYVVGRRLSGTEEGAAAVVVVLEVREAASSRQMSNVDLETRLGNQPVNLTYNANIDRDRCSALPSAETRRKEQIVR